MEAEDIKWYLEGGSINVIKNSGNIMTGNFSAKALLLITPIRENYPSGFDRYNQRGFQ